MIYLLDRRKYVFYNKNIISIKVMPYGIERG